MKRGAKILAGIAVMLAFMFMIVQVAYSADTKTVDVAASIPQQNGLTVSVSKVAGKTWSNATAIDFGSLAFDAVNRVFTAASYYAVDVGINSNAPDWVVTHGASSISNTAGTDNLDNNVNVVFVKQLDSNTDVALDKVTFANSDKKAFTRNQLTGGWLRIYYGIATGDTAEDAPGAVPVDANKPFGDYKGSVTLTLTP